MTDRYNTPASGSLDWDVPLNENFNRLDIDVEVRDTDTNRGNYEPNDGAKFLATDTGAVYLGDGSSWNQIGTISSSGSSGEVSDGSVVATTSDDVQSVMDANATGQEWGPQAMQTVKLVSGATYTPSSTWVVPSGIKLDCNGAVIVPDGDFNVIELDRSTEVHEPRINAGSGSFTSVAITITTPDANKAGTPNPATVYDAHLHNNENDGVGIQFRGGELPCSMQRATGKITNFDRGVEFRSVGGDTTGQGDWSNGNRFRGNINGSRIPINLVSEDGAAVSGNIVRAQIQSGDGTEWMIRQEDAPSGTNIRSNTYEIFPWDTQNVSNSYQGSGDRRAPLWYIGTGQQEYNVLLDRSNKLSNEFVVNRSTTGWERNGVFQGAGVKASRGATDFDHPPVYKDNDAPFHPDS